MGFSAHLYKDRKKFLKWCNWIEMKIDRSLDCSLDYARDDIARDDIARDDNEAGMMGMG